MKKNRNIARDMVPICDRCGKVAPTDEDMSTSEWKVYRVKDPCECGGRFKPRCLVERANDNNVVVR